VLRVDLENARGSRLQSGRAAVKRRARSRRACCPTLTGTDAGRRSDRWLARPLRAGTCRRSTSPRSARGPAPLDALRPDRQRGPIGARSVDGMGKRAPSATLHTRAPLHHPAPRPGDDRAGDVRPGAADPRPRLRDRRRRRRAGAGPRPPAAAAIVGVDRSGWALEEAPRDLGRLRSRRPRRARRVAAGRAARRGRRPDALRLVARRAAQGRARRELPLDRGVGCAAAPACSCSSRSRAGSPPGGTSGPSCWRRKECAPSWSAS